MNNVAQFPYLKIIRSYLDKFIGKQVNVTLYNNSDLPTLSSDEILTHTVLDTDEQGEMYLEIHFEKLSLYLMEYEYDFKISDDEYGKMVFAKSKILEEFSFILILE